MHHNTNKECVYLIHYVDNMLLIGPNMKVVNKIKMELGKEFDMKDLRLARRILHMEINWDRHNSCLYVPQIHYVL